MLGAFNKGQHVMDTGTGLKADYVHNCRVTFWGPWRTQLLIEASWKEVIAVLLYIWLLAC